MSLAPIPIAPTLAPAHISLPIPDSLSSMRSLGFADERNVTTRRAGIGTGSPVLGLRPFP